MRESEEKITMMYLGMEKTSTGGWADSKLVNGSIKKTIMGADAGKLKSRKAAMKKIRRRG